VTIITPSALTIKRWGFPTECIYEFRVFLGINIYYFLRGINLFIFVMEEQCVFFVKHL